jgi:hypothetical protein
MKRFIFSALCVVVFFIGVGAIADSVSAGFGSDAKALEIVNRARIAIGGDPAIADIQNLVIKGSTTINIETPDGTSRTEKGESQMALEMPDKFFRSISLTRDGAENTGGKTVMSRTFDVTVVGDKDAPTLVTGVAQPAGSGDSNAVFTTDNGKTVVLRRVEGKPAQVAQTIELEPAAPGETVRRGNVIVENIKGAEAQPPQNEMLRVMLGLFLTPPKGIDVTYTFIGEDTIDSVPVNIVNAQAGGSSLKLYFSKLSSLPVMMSYIGTEMPRVFAIAVKGEPTAAEQSGDKEIRIVRRTANTEDIVGPEPEQVETTVKFSDHRFTNGLQLPYKWTTLRNGKVHSVFEVASYEKNVANIAEQFPGTNIRIKRVEKP